MNRQIIMVLLGLSAVLIVPVLVAQLRPSKQRSFERVALEDTSYQEINFQNAEQELNLGGMLFVPEGEGPFPAAVIIHGSGTSRRDNGWYLTLVQYLQDNGIVVLLPDKRGSEKSEGDWHTASFEDLATDTVAAVDFLANQDEVPISNVGIIGLSQGGHIAPIVAHKTRSVSFLVNIVGGAIPMHDLLVYEETHNLREMGLLPGISDLLAYPSAWFIINVRQKEFWNSVGNFDPIPYWQNLDIRALVLYGESDTNVPSSKSAQALQGINNPNIKVKIYENSGHALESPEGKGDSIFREDALQDILDFIYSVSVRE